MPEVALDDCRAIFLMRWYVEVDKGGHDLDDYQHPRCAGYRLTSDNNGDPFRWMSNYQVLLPVEMAARPNPACKMYGVHSADLKLVGERFAAVQGAVTGGKGKGVAAPQPAAAAASEVAAPSAAETQAAAKKAADLRDAARAESISRREAARTAQLEETAKRRKVSEPAAKRAATVKPLTSKALLSEADKLLKGVGKLRTDQPILSNRVAEWLNDCQLANDNALAMRPDNVYFMYPRDEEGAAAQFKCNTVARLANAHPPPCASVVLPYSVQQLHWHELFFSFLERVVYHFEGLGDELLRDSPVRLAFDTSLGAQGWQLVSICDKYQSDGSSCGVWLQAARDAWLLYVASPHHGTNTFPAFLQRTFEAGGAQSLSGLTARAKAAAERHNVAYIVKQRTDMRKRLVQAALDGKLSWGKASLEGFAPATAVDLDILE